ncbi:MAG TPA: hypothetical protein VG498_21260 [Terriglobales bacterium]|nr:hypothetical protein [Terriglobales bacterium]
MKRAALGFRMHSGWGVLVAIDDGQQVIGRYRIGVIGDKTPGGRQPYHYAAQLGLPAAEKYLSNYVSECTAIAREAIRGILIDLQSRFHLAGAAVLQASGRNLPPLPQILAAHPLIHTAEGKLFRDVVSRVCESLNIGVLEVPERELQKCLTESFAAAAPRVLEAIADAGKSLGPPWNADHKSAALGACLVLQPRTHTDVKRKASNA